MTFDEWIGTLSYSLTREEKIEMHKAWNAGWKERAELYVEKSMKLVGWYTMAQQIVDGPTYPIFRHARDYKAEDCTEWTPLYTGGISGPASK